MAIDAVDGYLASVGARRLAAGEWGLTVADEHPLDVGIRVVEGLVRVQAFALRSADAPASEDVLHWNRATRIVRFSRTRDGDVWVQADLPVGAVDSAEMDRLLGLVVEAARSARAAAYADAPADGGWLGLR
jgi:hypothetical protein